MCHKSHVMCHMSDSGVMSPMTPDILSFFLLLLDKLVELVSEGSVINVACPVKLKKYTLDYPGAGGLWKC